MTKEQDFQDIEALKNQEVAVSFLEKAIQRFADTGDARMFLKALRILTKVQGGMTALSRRTGINRQNLYRTFASTGNPKFKSLGAILKGLGYRLSVEPIPQDEKIKQEIDSTIEKIIANTTREEETV